MVKLIEKFEYKGVWWLPSKPGKKVSGTLGFTPNEGAILDLIGSFKDIKDINQILNPDIILGVSSNGKNITLYKCFETRSSLSLPGLLTSSFYASVVFVGVHFEKTEDIKFESLSIHCSYLDDWVNISGFNIQHLSDKKELLIKYKWPESIQVSVNDDLKISIVVHADLPTISVVQKEACIKQKTFIRIEPSKAKSLEEYWSIMYHIQNFLSFGVTEPVHPLAIEGITEAHKIVIGKGKTYHPPISIFYKLPDISYVSKPLMPFDMLFTFKDVSERFEVLLRNWFEKAEMLKPVYDLYFGTLYNPRMYLQHKFLSLVQAIESYHRRTMRNYELPEDEHQKRITEILDSVPSNYRKWLEWKFKYSNEPPLRQRLEDILEVCSEVLDEFIDDKSLFVDKTVDTRNYLTHYDPELKERSAEGEELHRLTQKLKRLLEICLLKELGFNSDDIESLISRIRRYQHE